MADYDGIVTGTPDWVDVPSLSASAIALGGAAGAGTMNAQATALVKRENFLLNYTFKIDPVSGFATLGASTPKALIHANSATAALLLTTPNNPLANTLLGRVSFGSYSYSIGGAYKASIDVVAPSTWNPSSVPVEIRFMATPGDPNLAPSRVAYIDQRGNASFGNSYAVDPSDTQLDRRLTVYSGASTDATAYFQNSTSGTAPSDGLKVGLLGSDATLINQENGFLRLGTNQTNLVSLTASGRVGIKTDSPSVAFEVNGDAKVASDAGLSIGSTSVASYKVDSGAFYLTLPTGINHDVRYGNVTTFRVSNGKASINPIGSVAPNVSLEINGTDAVKIPSGTNTQRPSNPALGHIRFSVDSDKPEFYSTSGWRLMAQAGVTGGDTNQVFFENENVVTSSYTISAGKNAGTYGPITIADGVTVTIPDGSTWTIV